MRNIVNGCAVVGSSITRGFPLEVAKLFEGEEKAVNVVKATYKRLGELINKF